MVVTPHFRSGDAAISAVTTRNLETLHFTAYRLNAESYFRNKQRLGNVETLDIGLVAPDASWTVPVPGYARYKPVAASYDLKRLELPGVYAVKATDEKTLQATALVLGSDLDAIVKASRDGPRLRPGHEDGTWSRGARNPDAPMASKVLLEAGRPEGVLLHTWDPVRGANQGLSYLVLDGPHVAGSGLHVPGQVAQGLSPRAYIYTDRPAYRPGQGVSVRGVVREVREGQYANAPKAVYRFEVADSRGRLIVARPVTLSEFGTFHESLPLDSGAPLGTYRVTVSQPGKSVFSGSFEVQSYQLEPIDLRFKLEKSVVYRGETVKGDVIARYQYGEPMASRPIEVGLPDGRTLHGTTDAAGKYHLEFSTEGFAEEQTLGLSARLPQDNGGRVRGGATGGPRLRDRPQHDPGCLPRRRVLRAPGRHDRRPGPADQRVAIGDAGQAGHRGGPGHRTRRHAQARRDRRRQRKGLAHLPRRRRPGRTLHPPGRRDRPVRHADRRRPGDHDLGEEGRDQARLWPTASGSRSASRPVNLHSQGRAPAQR